MRAEDSWIAMAPRPVWRTGESVLDLFQRVQDITAIVCETDLLAIGVLQACALSAGASRRTCRWSASTIFAGRPGFAAADDDARVACEQVGEMLVEALLPSLGGHKVPWERRIIPVELVVPPPSGPVKSRIVLALALRTDRLGVLVLAEQESRRGLSCQCLITGSRVPIASRFGARFSCQQRSILCGIRTTYLALAFHSRLRTYGLHLIEACFRRDRHHSDPRRHPFSRLRTGTGEGAADRLPVQHQAGSPWA